MLHPFDLRSFQSLYETHARDALALALLLTRDRAVAEDVVQEAFIKVARRFSDLRNPSSFGPYLRRTVVNLIRSRARRLNLERKSLVRIAADSAPTTSAATDLDEGELWDALSELPFRQRAALILRFCEDLSEREAAHILNTTEKAIRSLVGRGTEALRKQLGGGDAWIL